MSLSTEKKIEQKSGELSGFQQDFELLRDAAIFHGLEHECLKLLAMLCRRMEFGSGDQLVSQGEENDRGFLIISGRLDALYAEGEKKHVINSFGSGHFVYASALLGRIFPVFTLQARESARVLCFRRDEFHKALQQFPNSIARITDNLITALAHWDRNLVKKQCQSGGFDFQTIGISLL